MRPTIAAILLSCTVALGAIICHPTEATAVEWGVELHPQNQEYVRVWVYSARYAARVMFAKVKFFDEDGRDLGVHELKFPMEVRESDVIFPGETKHFALYHGIREADEVEGIDIKWMPIHMAIK